MSNGGDAVGRGITMAGDIQIDTVGREVLVNGQVVPFTYKEYCLLLYLVQHGNKLVSKHSIVENVWGDEADLNGNLDFIYTHLKNIRKKIKAAGGEVIIRSVYGVGYKLAIV